jgi:hypothetical protein
MRYIKLFEKFVIQPDVKIFESEKSLNIKNCLNDIFLDVEDEGIEVNIEDKYRRTPNYLNNGFRTSDIEELIGYKIIIGDVRILGESHKTFLLKDVYDSIKMAKDYMSDEGFVISEMIGEHQQGHIYEAFNLLYNFNLYEQGRSKLFDEPLTCLEIDFMIPYFI